MKSEKTGVEIFTSPHFLLLNFMDFLRLFIAVDLPEHVKQILQIQQDQLKEQLGDSSIHWTTPDQWHLALKFLGATPVEKLNPLQHAMQRSIAKLEPFELSTAGLGTFPSFQRPSILWLGIGGDTEQLQHLNLRLTQNLTGFFEDQEPAFRAHITLARIKQFGLGRQVMKAFASTKPIKANWTVDAIDLYSSLLKPIGSEYKLLHRLALQQTQTPI